MRVRADHDVHDPVNDSADLDGFVLECEDGPCDARALGAAANVQAGNSEMAGHRPSTAEE